MNFILFNFRNQINKNNQINKKQKNTVNIRRQPFLKQYIFYAILNTDLHMNRGVAAANVIYILYLINILCILKNM